MATNREIKYINKDFSQLRQTLIDYTKTYYPTTYNDFSPSSPGMLFMEMAAYVGDVLSFYLDNQFQETFLQYARETNNVYELAYMFGYKPKTTQVATTDIEIFQKLPVTGASGSRKPDFDYSLFIDSNFIVSQTNANSIDFLIEDPIDFSSSSSSDPTEITVFEISGDDPQSFLLKKTRKAISATINEITISAGSTPIPFYTYNLSGENIIGILDITDENGNIWYEVDTLGQEMVFNSIKNTNPNDPNLSGYSNDAPYLLKLEKQPRRFTTRFTSETNLQIQFGSGTVNDSDEEIVPNPNNVGLGLPFEKNKLTTAFSPSNFLFTQTYGIAPTGDLTIRYLTGGGVAANIPANNLTNYEGNINFLTNNLSDAQAQIIFDSLATNNPKAADGGGDGDSLINIKQNASSNYSTQLRNVTQDDYLVRALSMPSKYGVISKAFIEPTKIQNISSGESNSVLDLYVLSYNINKQISLASSALKQNLSTYLSAYRMVNDSINIKDGFIINIGLNFDIIVLPEFNNNQVLTDCITALQNYFDIDNWQINQPIILREIYILLDKIKGVQTVKNIEITNKVGENLGYSQFEYDIQAATTDQVVYPSLDPSIFEIKYPNTDIQGRVVPL